MNRRGISWRPFWHLAEPEVELRFAFRWRRQMAPH
jgi:hypothetical protein